MLEAQLALSRRFLQNKYYKYERYFLKKHSLNNQLTILTGQRGIGKTTLLIQHLLKTAQQDYLKPDILYVPADHFLLGDIALYTIAEQFCMLGGKTIAFDEIHKYGDWAKELKSIYDTFPDLKVLASGSSALEIYKGSHDLTRRAITYNLYGLSLREYLELAHNIALPAYSLEEILNNHIYITEDLIKILNKINKKILVEFHYYLKYGYYPYNFELNSNDAYYLTLDANMHTTIEADLLAIYPFLTGNSVNKLKKIISFISNSVPFVINWHKLCAVLQIGDERTLKNYIHYLHKAGLLQLVTAPDNKLKNIADSEKIYIHNPNQQYALAKELPNIGTIRELFFLNMLQVEHTVNLAAKGDFMVDEQYTFEIGGANKTQYQVKDINNSFICSDNIEHGINNKIPLWLFGFIY